MIVYTDGAYSSSTDCGGIGIVFVDKGEYCKKYTHTTNQRMEVKAAIIALQSIKEPTEVTIISDSAYLVKTMNNEFKRKANLDLWEILDKAVSRHIKVEFKWIRGHNGDINNERADCLATTACKLM